MNEHDDDFLNENDDFDETFYDDDGNEIEPEYDSEGKPIEPWVLYLKSLMPKNVFLVMDVNAYKEAILCINKIKNYLKAKIEDVEFVVDTSGLMGESISLSANFLTSDFCDTKQLGHIMSLADEVAIDPGYQTGVSITFYFKDIKRQINP